MHGRLAVASYGRNRSGEFSAPAGRRLDGPGQASSALGILAIVFAVIRGGSAGWTDPACVAALCISVLAVTVFFMIETRSESPLLRPSLFASGGFTAAGVAAMSVLFSIVGVVFVLSLLFTGNKTI